MKKMVSVLIAIMLILAFCVGLTACGDTGSSNGNNPSTNNPTDDNPTPEPFSVDLAGYVANIGNAKALGISKEVSTSVSHMSTRNTNSGIQLLSYTPLASNKDTEDKNYIVMSTVDYDANTPEADKTGLTKVTFTKIVTENVTTETTGTRYIIANESSISISATTGFKYTVYYNDSLIYNEVQDNDDNDKEPKEGVIVLDNLIDGIEYKVSYKGIGVETTITQDDINGEIDKLYVLNNYTFISFVPQGESLRPEDKYLDFDNNGIASYDRINYFSSTDRQSFVIDNSTGLVYHIKDTQISEIKNNLLIINNKIFDMMVNDNDELQFTQVVQNETIQIHNYFKDKFENKYIQNNVLDAYDQINKTVYYTKTNYFLSQEGVAIHIEYTGQFNYNEMPSSYTCIEKIDENFAKSSIKESDTFILDFSPCNGNSSHDESNVNISHIENGYLYMYSTQGGAYTYYNKINVTTKNINYKSYGIYGYDGGNWTYNCLKSLPINHDTVLIWCDWFDDEKSRLFYANVWEDDWLINGTINESKITVILEDITVSMSDYIWGDWSFNLEELRFRKTTFTETIYYKIIIDENGNPKAVNSETYVAPEKETITLQPLNK